MQKAKLYQLKSHGQAQRSEINYNNALPTLRFSDLLIVVRLPASQPPMGVHAQCVSCNKWPHGNLAVYAERLLDVLKANQDNYEIEYYKIFVSTF